MPSSKKASAVLNTLPTLNALRMFSNTAITGILSACLNSSTDLRLSSDMESFFISFMPRIITDYTNAAQRYAVQVSDTTMIGKEIVLVTKKIYCDLGF